MEIRSQYRKSAKTTHKNNNKKVVGEIQHTSIYTNIYQLKSQTVPYLFISAIYLYKERTVLLNAQNVSNKYYFKY